MDEIFKKSCKKLYIGNLLEVIFELLLLPISIILVSTSDPNLLSISAIGSFVSTFGLLVAAVIVILGILKLRNTNDILYKAFIFFCISFIANLSIGFIKDETAGDYLSLVSSIILIVSNVFLIKGIVKENKQFINLSKKVLLIYLVSSILGLIIELLGLLIPNFNQISTIINSITHAIGYISLIVLFKKSS